MDPFRVFISSIMNPAIEDLLNEREAAQRAVEQFAPITKPWAFEAEPASSKPLLDFCLGAVRTCDLFVLIVGQCVTDPVKAECQTARDYGNRFWHTAKRFRLDSLKQRKRSDPWEANGTHS